MSNTFSWKTKFKSIIIVDGELFGNEYNLKISLTPHTANLKEQTEYSNITLGAASSKLDFELVANIN